MTVKELYRLLRAFDETDEVVVPNMRDWYDAPQMVETKCIKMNPNNPNEKPRRRVVIQ